MEDRKSRLDAVTCVSEDLLVGLAHCTCVGAHVLPVDVKKKSVEGKAILGRVWKARADIRESKAGTRKHRAMYCH